MRKPWRTSDIFRTRGFWIHYQIGRLLRVGFASQCWIAAAVAAGITLAGSMIDGSLILAGRNVGLLEHPGIWAFFGLQVALPLSIRHSLKRLLRARVEIRQLGGSDEDFYQKVLSPIRRFLDLRDKEGRLAATIAYSVGLTAFVWNTYQNQRPGIVVPFDFWDSTTYPWGFWITRVYKLYLYAWLLPYVSMIHIAILVVTLRLIRRARLAGKLELLPFHSDGLGGLGFIPGLVSTPVIVTLIAGSIPVAAAFEVHRAADVTPLMGFAIIVISAGTAYIVPILVLRADIVAMMRTLIRRLRLLQQTYYARILEDHNARFETLHEGNEALDYFDRICTRVQAISNYPHLTRLLKFVGLALTPSAISLALKLFDDIRPILGGLIKQP
jgi:hypothetical protein